MSTLWKYERMRIISQRMLALILLFFVLVFILVARLFYLQIIEGDKYLQMAEKNRTAVRQTLPTRGYIYDRNGVKLAENRKTFLAVLMREQTPDYHKTLDNFRKIIPLDEEELARIEKEIKRKRAFMPIRVKDNLSFDEAAKIQLNAPDLMGIQTQEETTRLYPLGADAAHVVGYVSLLTDSDMMKNPNNPLLDLPGYRIGRVGVEQAWEHVLQGKPGKRKTEINAYGRTVRVLEEVKAEKGENLTLTLDADLQKFALKAMGEEAGSAVVLDVKTGEILALVSAPSFDANVFTMPIPKKVWNGLIDNEKNPLQNKAINGVYSPGSIFKLIVALAGLESGHITADRKIFCSGRVEIGNHFFHCWKRGGHGHLTLEEALMHSCDVYFYQVAQEIGSDKILEVAQRLGFGSLTGSMLKGEKAGLLPSKQWKKEKYDESWRLGDTLNLSIGQGYLLATPLQMGRAVAQIANGGYPITPHLVKERQAFVASDEESHPNEGDSLFLSFAQDIIGGNDDAVPIISSPENAMLVSGSVLPTSPAFPPLISETDEAHMASDLSYTEDMKLILSDSASMKSQGGYAENMPVSLSKTDATTSDTPPKLEKPAFKPEHIRLVKSGMNMVVNKVGGTGYKSRFNLNGQTMAGKTASTQVRRISMKERKTGVIAQDKLPWKYRDHAMFAAFAPVASPRFAVVVVVEHGSGGSKTAAPIASRIMQETLRLYPNQTGELKRERAEP